MTGSGRPRGPRRWRLAALLMACGLGADGCGAPAGPPISWTARTAEAELERAQAAVKQGDRERALDLGRRALQDARKAAALGTVGRALTLVGQQEVNLAPCLEAIEIFQQIGDVAGLIDAQLGAAEVLLAVGHPDQAALHLEQAGSALERAQFERPQWARVAARLRHSTAVAQRELGQREQAQASERQAELALSLLADTEEMPLRIAVQLGLGAAEASRGWPDRAMGHYGRVLEMAQVTGDRRGQIDALTGMVVALADLHRYSDAVSRCERALALATDLDDQGQVRRLGLLGLQLLDLLGEEADSGRRRAFEEALLAGG